MNNIQEKYVHQFIKPKAPSFVWNVEAVVRRCFVKVFLEILQNPQESICVRVSLFNKFASLSKHPENVRTRFSDVFRGYREVFNFIKKENLARVFSCEFCEISKNTSSGCFHEMCHFCYFRTLPLFPRLDPDSLKSTKSSSLIKSSSPAGRIICPLGNTSTCPYMRFDI